MSHAERLLLAWLRSAIALMGFGFVVARVGMLSSDLDHHRVESGVVGIVLTAGGMLLSISALYRFLRELRAARPGTPVWKGATMPFILASSTVLAGGLLVWLIAEVLRDPV